MTIKQLKGYHSDIRKQIIPFIDDIKRITTKNGGYHNETLKVKFKNGNSWTFANVNGKFEVIDVSLNL